LAQVLRHMPTVDDPRVLVDIATRDDAAVYRITDDRAIVATVDFFTPIVDDPYDFGAIAAANAFSDIYAMGARPLFALNLVAWPRDPAMLQLLGKAIEGGVDVARDAGALVLGGHSVDDPEPKLGMVVVGEVHPDEILDNTGARPGDMLVLTKPIGTGILSTALKNDKIAEADMDWPVKVMSTLNAGAAAAMSEIGDAVHAATDVTGYGLLGHLHNMLAASGVSARVTATSVPVFEGVPDLIEAGAIPGGTKRNQTASETYTTWAERFAGRTQVFLADAQTSGGLLIAVDPSRADDLVAALQERRTPTAAVIGEVVEGQSGTIHVV
jgi:selenide,water dikinase